MKILLLGSNGKVGYNLAKYLIKNTEHKFILHSSKKNNLINDNFTLTYFDVNYNLSNLFDNLIDVDVIINCIGSYKKSEDIINLNYTFIKNFFNMYKIKKIINKIHWIQLSSIGVYYNPLFPTNIIDEDSELKFINLYEKTKLKADKLIEDFSNLNSNFTYTIIRPSIFFGSNNLDSTFNKIINFTKKKYFFYINDNKTILPFIHIEDFSKFIKITLENKDKKAKNKIFNLSNNFKLSELYNFVSKKNNKVITLKYIYLFIPVFFLQLISRKDTIQKLNFLSSKSKFLNKNAEKYFDFTPKISLIDYYEKKNK